MLAIRLQRTGRKNHAQFRVIVQEAQLSPKSGKVAAYLGAYDPHTKVTNLDKEKAEFYLSNGAQPSNRVAKLLKSEGVKLPEWVVIDTSKKGKVKKQKEEAPEAPVDEAEATEEAKADEDKPAAAKSEEPAEEAAKEEKAEDKPEEEAKDEKPEAQEKPADEVKKSKKSDEAKETDSEAEK